MESKHHSEADRTTIARLAGAASRHASLRAASLQNFDPAIAVTELHKISTDPHLLAHATTYPQHYLYSYTRELLKAAGANMADLDTIAMAQQARMGQGLAALVSAPAAG